MDILIHSSRRLFAVSLATSQLGERQGEATVNKANYSKDVCGWQNGHSRRRRDLILQPNHSSAKPNTDSGFAVRKEV